MDRVICWSDFTSALTEEAVGRNAQKTTKREGGLLPEAVPGRPLVH